MRGLGVEMFRQAIDLLDVKHCVALHEGDRGLRLLAGRGIGRLAHDGIGIDDEAAILALANAGLEVDRLPEGLSSIWANLGSTGSILRQPAGLRIIRRCC